MDIKNVSYNPDKTALAFWGSIFSNFYSCIFKHEGLEFISSEQAFMWHKATHFKDKETAKLILQSTNPKAAKNLGRQVKNFDNSEWDKVRFNYMVKVLKSKFSSSKYLLDSLLLTKEVNLIEGSPFDKIWGVGIHYKEADVFSTVKWKGSNLLGEALMKVREYLKYLQYICFKDYSLDGKLVMQNHPHIAFNDEVKCYLVPTLNFNYKEASEIVFEMYKSNTKEHSSGIKETTKPEISYVICSKYEDYGFQLVEGSLNNFINTDDAKLYSVPTDLYQEKSIKEVEEIIKHMFDNNLTVKDSIIQITII